MKNLLEIVKKRTMDLAKTNSNQFNTSDFLLETIKNKPKTRQDVIDLIIAERIKLSGQDVEKMADQEVDDLIQKLYRTSKNGLDTAVSDSQNNSSFSFNEKYRGWKLVKTGNILEIVAEVEKVK